MLYAASGGKRMTRICTTSSAAVIAFGSRKVLGALLAALLVASGTQAATPTDLAIRATSKALRIGTNGIYTVTVSNRGPAATDADIHVTDLLPDGLSLVSSKGANWTCSATGQAVDCSRTAPLPSRKSTTFRIVVSVCNTDSPTVTHLLSVVYPADTSPANNSVSKTNVVKPGRRGCTPPPTLVTPAPPGGTPIRTATATFTPAPAETDLTLSKTVATSFYVGANGAYALKVTNVGTATTNGAITVSDVLPSSLGFVSATGADWTCSANGQAVTCTNPVPLAPTATTSVTLVVSVSSAAYPTITNSATLSYAGDRNATNNTAIRPTTVRK
jgi:uncharacterized repeat protein (TIGR01451 family)